MKAADAKNDQYGRAWGSELWRGGPILGGRDHRAFVERSIATETARVDLRYEPVVTGAEAPEATRRAALRYVLQAFGSDLMPITTVTEILAGRRPDLVRDLLSRRQVRAAAPAPAGEWEVPA